MSRSLFPLLVALLAPSLARAQPAPSRSRVAIHEFIVDGQEATPALQIQLEDGFIVGLTRAGIPVLEGGDVTKKLQPTPELVRCETALCLKRLGEVLAVPHVMRVHVSVAGNSYKMTARLFSTRGDPPALLPLDNQTRACDVCTVAEARETMIRLADAMKRTLDEAPAVTQQAPAAPPRRAWKPYAALGAGLCALLAGAATFFSAASPGDKGVPALGGALMGAGAAVGAVGAYLIVLDQREAHAPPQPRLGVGISLRF